MDDKSRAVVSPIKENEYRRRINLVLDYLADTNYKQQELAHLSQIAHFSPFHFHRIFKGVMKESVYKYIQRMRLEKAAHKLTFQKHVSITEIAFDAGFNSSATFARAFKLQFGMSASQWRVRGEKTNSKNSKVISKKAQTNDNNWQVVGLSPLYIDSRTQHPNWRIIMNGIKDVTIEVKQIPAKRVAYIRHLGEFQGETKKWNMMFEKLITWATANEFIACPGTDYFTVFRDDLTLGKFESFKSDVCLTVPEHAKPSQDICIGEIGAGKYAVAYFEIEGKDIAKAWQSIYSEWLPNSGYLPDEGASYERYLNDPKLHPDNILMVEICIPVKAL